jgi:hypothetical protein
LVVGVSKVEKPAVGQTTAKHRVRIRTKWQSGGTYLGSWNRTPVIITTNAVPSKTRPYKFPATPTTRDLYPLGQLSVNEHSTVDVPKRRSNIRPVWESERRKTIRHPACSRRHIISALAP